MWMIGVDEDGDPVTEPRLVENEEGVDNERELFEAECPEAVAEVIVVKDRQKLIDQYGCDEDEIPEPE